MMRDKIEDDTEISEADIGSARDRREAETETDQIVPIWLPSNALRSIHACWYPTTHDSPHWPAVEPLPANPCGRPQVLAQ